jgi:hypothetical protein
MTVPSVLLHVAWATLFSPQVLAFVVLLRAVSALGHLKSVGPAVLLWLGIFPCLRLQASFSFDSCCHTMNQS